MASVTSTEEDTLNEETHDTSTDKSGEEETGEGQEEEDDTEKVSLLVVRPSVVLIAAYHVKYCRKRYLQYNAPHVSPPCLPVTYSNCPLTSST